MGYRYSVAFDDVASGASADTYLTIASIIVAANERVRLRSLQVGPADNSAENANFVIKVGRTDASGAGTPGTTIAVGDVAKADPNQPDSHSTCGLSYAAEPTAYATYPPFTLGVHTQGGFIKEWDEDSAPALDGGNVLGILIAPRAAAAVRVSGTMEFETY